MSLFARFFDFTPGSVSHVERLVSALGGFVSIVAIMGISAYYLGREGALLIVPSMGASAVLLFAVPHGALSQPWNVLGGHLVSALVGVSCFLLIPQPLVAAGMAVGLAIGVMYYLRCIHPPGGATALVAVIGGDSVHELGYQFVVTPVLQNALIMLAVAVIFNYAFRWRRYPSWLAEKGLAGGKEESNGPAIQHADLVAALGQIDSYIDVSENDLLRIYELASGQAQNRQLQAEQIVLGGYYSNGAVGTEWSVRQVVDQSSHPDPERDMVVYKVVAGKGLRSSGVETRSGFAQWARYELVRDNEKWKRIGS